MGTDSASYLDNPWPDHFLTGKQQESHYTTWEMFFPFLSCIWFIHEIKILFRKLSCSSFYLTHAAHAPHSFISWPELKPQRPISSPITVSWAFTLISNLLSVLWHKEICISCLQTWSCMKKNFFAAIFNPKCMCWQQEKYIPVFSYSIIYQKSFWLW